MTGLSGLWIALSLAATGGALAFGASPFVSFLALGAAMTPLASGTFLAHKLSRAGRLELEIALWLVAAVGAAGSAGGAWSPHVLWFVPGLMLAAVKGDRRLRFETAAFTVLGFGAAVLAGWSGGWVHPADSWRLGIGYGAALLALSAAIGMQAPQVSSLITQRLRFRANPDARVNAAASDPISQAKTTDHVRRLESEAASAREQAAAAESKLSQRMQFFAQTSHELRTPLNAIVGFADMMAQQVFGALPDKYAEYARLIREGGRTLNALVDDVTDLARIEAGRYDVSPEVISITDILAEAIGFLSDTAERKTIALQLSEPSDVEGYADPRAVRQIAFNLISNALKFTPAGGQVLVSASESDGGVRVTVADNGVGITPEDLTRLSQAFEQGGAGKSAKGSGLGLSIVKAFADLHGGQLTIASRPEGGAVVSVFFPSKASWDAKMQPDGTSNPQAPQRHGSI